MYGNIVIYILSPLRNCSSCAKHITLPACLNDTYFDLFLNISLIHIYNFGNCIIWTKNWHRYHYNWSKYNGRVNMYLTFETLMYQYVLATCLLRLSFDFWLIVFIIDMCVPLRINWNTVVSPFSCYCSLKIYLPESDRPSRIVHLINIKMLVWWFFHISTASD